MLEAYGTSIEVTAESPISFQSISVKKGCTATMSGDSTISLNKKGVYMVSFNCTSSDATTVQLYKNGVAQPQAQGTGTTPSFTTLVQVDHDNSECCCSSPTTLQVLSSAAVTFVDANVVVTKLN